MTFETGPKVARQARHLPGEPGIWLFIAGDLVIFSLFFILLLWCRGENESLYAASQAKLNQTLGLVNTLLMLTSSWFVVQAVNAARRNMGYTTAIGFALAFLCGVCFTIVKAFEYGAKIREGIVPTTNDFFMYYFVFSGIHLMHVLIGMAVLAFMVFYCWRGSFNERKQRDVETAASFWHMVDLLWIVLFALLYLVK